ncbi:TPA: restriction endonuclease subunit S [Pasteurella multocida]|nr:restriction endonuclease subunit S [Pasteurella multocida]
MSKEQSPRLRFHGFMGKWEESKLENIVEFFAGLTYSPLDIVENGILVLRSSNVHDSQIVTEDNVFVKESAVNCQNVEIGDVIVVVRNGSRNLIGKHAIIKEKMPNTVIGAFMTGLKSNQPDFLNALLDSNKFNKEIEKNLGATINQITTGAFKKMEFSFPSLPEQTHIGNFFRHLGQQIAECRIALEKSRQLKKAMLTKMFPAKGEKIPQIRFKGFEGAWERKKFGDIAELRRGLTYSPIDISTAGIRVLRSSNIDEDTYTEKYDDVFVLESAVNIPLVQNGDILITSANGSSRLVGKHAIIEGMAPAVHGGFMILARTKNPYFLNASMSSAWYMDFIRIFVSGGNGAIGNLSMSDLIEQEILIPSEKEQTTIGNFFRQLDETIALQVAEIEKLTQLKKGLLSAMLV